MYYEFYHAKDFENILKSLKDLRPSFKKFKNTEVYTEGIVVGKFNDVVFVVSEERLNLGLAKIGSLEVEFGEVFELRDGKLIVDRKDEETLYDYIPSVFAEYFKLKAFLSELESYAEVINRYEGSITEELKGITNPRDVNAFKDTICSVSTRHGEMLKWMCTMKRIEVKALKSLMNLELLAGKEFEDVLRGVKIKFEYFKTLRENFEKTLDRLSEIFQMTSLRLDAIRNEEFLDLQRRTSALQVAGGVIEFVAVFYYTLKAWVYFVDLEDVPRILTFLLLTTFTIIVVWLTEGISEVVMERKISKKVVALSVLLGIVFALMINVTYLSRFLRP